MIFTWRVMVEWDNYTRRFDVDKWRDVYNHSQYCVPDCEYRGVIDDPELYSLAGYDYAHGVDPLSINFETQPFIKYLYGVSIILFGNAVVVQSLMGTLLLLVVYLSSRTVFGALGSLLTVMLVLVDPLFSSQLVHAYLDLPLTLYLLLYLHALYSLGKGKGSKLVVGIMLGIVALSKSFSIGILVDMVGLVYLKLVNKKQLFSYLGSLVVSIVTYCLGYSMYFYYNPNLLEFGKLHLDILRLYKGYVPEYPKGEIFRIIFAGKWRKWFDDFGLTHVSEWTIMWPLSVLESILALLSKKARENSYVSLHLLWIVAYFVFISLRLVFPRYLLPILPSLYLVSVYYLRQLLQKMQQLK